MRSSPHPENLDNHFVVDPAKFDFYSMDYDRVVGGDQLGRTLAEEVLRAGADFDGSERSPMRNAEARVALEVAAAGEGDLEQALLMGVPALQGDRQSVPLIMTSRELTAEMSRRYSRNQGHGTTSGASMLLGRRNPASCRSDLRGQGSTGQRRRINRLWCRRCRNAVPFMCAWASSVNLWMAPSSRRHSS